MISGSYKYVYNHKTKLPFLLKKSLKIENILFYIIEIIILYLVNGISIQRIYFKWLKRTIKFDCIPQGIKAQERTLKKDVFVITLLMVASLMF